MRSLLGRLSCPADLAAISARADGLMTELHYNPSEGLVDGPRMVTPDEMKDIIDVCKTLHKAKKKLRSSRP